MSDLALREDREGVAIVTLNRPDKLNAINREMQQVIFKAIADLRDRADLRVLLIKARGRFFTAGVDIREGAGGADDPSGQTMVEMRRGYRRNLHVHLDEMEAIEKPVVMAIHGPCLGLGVEIASAADFRIATDSARFGLPEIDVGVIAGSGGTSRFTRLCGISWSKWLSVAGEQMDARTAMIAGFVQAIYPEASFDEEVWRFCQRLISRPAEVQGVAKIAVDMCYDLDRTGARHLERIVNTPLIKADRSAYIENVLGRSKKHT
jgi:enoyl-CoA hydratase/carnithine racemase